jgi:hypothetical protein
MYTSGDTTPSLRSEIIATPFSHKSSDRCESQVKSGPLQWPCPASQAGVGEHLNLEKTAPISLRQSRFWLLRQFIEDQHKRRIHVI